MTSVAWAAPQGGSVVAGSAAIDAAGGVTTITQATDRAIVNWQGFSTAAGEAVRFAQPGAASVTLNRVTGAGHSQLDGSLTANGRVFVLNPNGVVFGATSQVNAAGLVASSLAMNDADFMAGRYRLAQEGARAGAVVNKGRIETTQGGRVALVAPAVANEGTISAPGGAVALAAGARATVNLDCGMVDLDVDAGSVRRDVYAPAGASEALSTAVNNRNLVAAGTATLENGEVVLGAAEGVAVNTGAVSAQRVSIDSTQLSLIAGQGEARGADVRVLGQDRVALIDQARVDASGATGGGRALIGGGREGAGVPAAKMTLVARDASVSADALCEGDGGEVVVRGGESARVRGALSARGGAAGGDGGFIETSAPRLDVKARVDIGAAAGKGGEWLIDPQNITVVAGCGLSNATQCGGGACVTFNTTGCCATIGVDCIVAALAGAACATVTVQTGAAGGGAGDININATIDYCGIGTGDTLNFSAHGAINVNQPVLDGTPGGDSLQFNLTAGAGAITVNAPITANGVSMVTPQDITFAAAVDAGAAATITGLNILDAGGGSPVLTAGAVNFGGAGAGGVFQSGNPTLPFRMSAQNIIAVKCGDVRLCNTRSGSVTICGLVGGAFDLVHNAPPGGGIIVGCCGISAASTLLLVAAGANQTIQLRNASGTAVQIATGPCGTISQLAGRVTGTASVGLSAGTIGCGTPVLTDTPSLGIVAQRAGGPVVQVNDLQAPATLCVDANLNNGNTFAIREDCGAPTDLLVLCGASLSGSSTGDISLNAGEPLISFTLNGLTAANLSVITQGDLIVGPGGATATGASGSLTSFGGNLIVCGNFDVTAPGATLAVTAGGGGVSGPGTLSQCGGNVAITARCSIGAPGAGALRIGGGPNASLIAGAGVGGTGSVFVFSNSTLTVNDANAQNGVGDVELTSLCGGLQAPAGPGPFIRGNRVTLSAATFIGSCCGALPMNMDAATLVASLSGNGQFVNASSLCAESVVNCGPGSQMNICANGTLSLKTVVGANVFLGATAAIVDADGDTDVTASAVTMNAPGGIGAANAIDLDVPVVQVSGLCSLSNVRIASTNAAGFANVTIGCTSGTVCVTANAGGASQIGVSAISGSIVTLVATGAVVDADIADDNDFTATTLSVTAVGFGAPCAALRIETAVSQLTINSAGGNVGFDNTGSLTLLATADNLSATTSGGLALCGLTALVSADVTAGGAITDANGGLPNVTIGTAVLTGTSVGTLADPLEVNLADLTVNAGSGDIAISSLAGLTFEGHTTGTLALGSTGAVVLRTSDAGTATIDTDDANITGQLNAATMILNALPLAPCAASTSTINVCIGGGGVTAMAGALTRVAATGTVAFVAVNGGSVDLSSAADVTVGSVTAGSSAIIVSGGDILDGGGTIVSPILSLFANGCVGIAGDAIEIAAGSLSTHAITGSVFVADLDALDVSSAIAAGSIDLKANGDLGVGAVTACSTVRLESVSGNVLATDPCAFIDATSASIFAAGVAGDAATPIEVCLSGRLAVAARGQIGGVSGAFEGTAAGARILALGAVPGQLLLNGVSSGQRVGSIVRLAQLDPALAQELFGANGLLAVQAIQNQDKALARQLFRTAPLVFASVATPAGGPAALGTLPLGRGLLTSPPPAADVSTAPDPVIDPDDESF